MKTKMTKQQWTEIGTKTGWLSTAQVHRRQTPVMRSPEMGWKGITNPSKATSEVELAAILTGAFATLSPNESAVLEKLFGLKDEAMSVEEIAAELGVGIEAVNELRSSGSAKIAEYLGRFGIDESIPMGKLVAAARAGMKKDGK